MKIERLLIANRGEIARRIQRTCRALGIHTVAIYSDADSNMPNVQEADTAIALGSGTAADTYLNSDKVIAAAKEANADAIHPGYGFLSENTAFAAACEEAGIIFVGPPANAIQLMGDKAAARLHMADKAVPTLPGFDETADAARLKSAADEVGYPLLIKPVAGGGGKGMHVVESGAAFDATLVAAQREAKNAFGDDRILLERYLPSARHVEVQVFADTQGNAVYLFERDCSFQRRHQKVVEEAPAPGLDDALRQRMGEAAVEAALSVNYVGAGTVEFLLAPDGGFYFMEMNTRLQVEHPVTEAVTGEDLVAWQIAVAEGKPLPKRQDELTLHGHAIEVRLYAEDPWQGFLPSAGKIAHLQWPPNIRIDAGVEKGDNISSLYDPMIAKLIAYGDNREEARQNLVAALEQMQLAGPKHNTGFLHRLLTLPDFIAVKHDTNYIDSHPGLTRATPPEAEVLALAAMLAAQKSQPAADPWHRLSGWRPLGQRHYQQTLDVNSEAVTPMVTDGQARIGEDTRSLRWHHSQQAIQLTWGNTRFEATYFLNAALEEITLFHQGQDYRIGLAPPNRNATAKDQGFVAPMSGTLLLQHVAAGANVKQGDAIVTLEAMKMEHTLYAPEDGQVITFHAEVGNHVSAGTQLLDFQPNEESPK